jgi:very-short-patch-repair endonuclease
MGRAGAAGPQRLAGVVTAGELAAAGVSAARIRSLLRGGVLRPVSRGVYASAAAMAVAARRPAGDHAVQVAVALALTGPHAAGSHQSAALVHGIGLLSPAPPGTVVVTRPAESAGSRTPRRGIRLHTAGLPGGHVVIRDQVRVTSVARTVIDLARSSSFRAGVVAADSALHRGLTSVTELEAVLADCARWPGITRAREVVGFSDGRSESALESLSRVVFHEQRLPPPELQVWVGDEVARARADFLWRRYRTVGEADGAVKYDRPAAAQAQLQRDARLRAAGFEVVHFTWGQVVRVPHQVAASIRAAFERAGRLGTAPSAPSGGSALLSAAQRPSRPVPARPRQSDHC